METTTIYRADDYFNNTGQFLGFFIDKEDAKDALEFNNETKIGDGDFSQITGFTVSTSEFEKGDINDREFMMKLWGESEIFNQYYYDESGKNIRYS